MIPIQTECAVMSYLLKLLIKLALLVAKCMYDLIKKRSKSMVHAVYKPCILTKQNLQAIV